MVINFVNVQEERNEIYVGNTAHYSKFGRIKN